MGIISLATTGAENGSSHVKFSAAEASGANEEMEVELEETALPSALYSIATTLRLGIVKSELFLIVAESRGAEVSESCILETSTLSWSSLSLGT